jgi:hypothetical protein
MKSPKLGLLSLFLWISAGVLSASAVAQVSGKLVLGAYKPAAPVSKRPACNWELENGLKEVRPDRVDARRELAVVLLGDGQPKGLDRREVALTGGGLLPSTIVVRTGTTLLVRNDDEIAHELFAKGAQGFAAEATAPRGRRSLSLTTAGAWPLQDQLVTHVTGHLYVFSDLIAVATIDAEGQFSFKDVEPGKYTLKVFHGDKELESQPVELGARPLSINPITLMATSGSK